MRALFLLEFLRGLGAGEGLMVIAVIGVVLLYLFRGKKLAGAAASMFGTAWLVAVTVGLTLLAVLVLGWGRHGAIVNDVLTWGGVVGNLLAEGGDDALEFVMEMVGQ